MVQMKSLVLAGAGLAAMACLAQGARAGLGEGADSLVHDRAALHGTSEIVTPMAFYDLHEVMTEDGTRVREYVSRYGTVFGIAWSGRTKPDLSVLLAAHY